MSDISVFRVVSTGQVLENLKIGERVISVKLIEQDPFTDGETKEVAEELAVDGVDDSGNAYSLSVVASNGVEATWLPLGKTNHKVAPNVRRGERVQIWQSGDEDAYYWTELGLDHDLRRGETVVIAFSNRFDNDNDSELSMDDCYFIEASTHLGHFLLQTSKSNSEKFQYRVELSTKESQFVVEDDANNHILMNSEQRLLRLHNTDGSFFELNKKNIAIYAPDSISAVAKKTIAMQAKTVNIKADNCNISAETLVDGNCTVTKKLSAATIASKGGLSAGGTISAKGPVETEGVMYASKFIER